MEKVKSGVWSASKIWFCVYKRSINNLTYRIICNKKYVKLTWSWSRSIIGIFKSTVWKTVSRGKSTWFNLVVIAKQVFFCHILNVVYIKLTTFWNKIYWATKTVCDILYHCFSLHPKTAHKHTLIIDNQKAPIYQ